GASNDHAAPSLTSLEVTPTESILIEPINQAQITAKAHFSDSTVRDVTSIAVYESANPIVKISPNGLVKSDQPGETTVLVRYLNQQVPVRRASPAPRAECSPSP